MNIKKTKLALALTGALFLTLPMSQAFAHEDHCEIKETELGDIMKYMKSELRAYVKAFKSDDQEKMQQHVGELIKLSGKAAELTPVTIAQMGDMDHSQMDMTDMAKGAAEMDAAHDMAEMDSGDAEQHRLHMQYLKEINELQDTFEALSATTDKTAINELLAMIKEQTKTGHKQFRQDCK